MGKNLDYSTALEMLKDGHCVGRAGWNGKGMYLWLVQAGAYRLVLPPAMLLGLETLPWIGMKTADNKFVPWLCSQTDALADDWEVVK